MGEKKTTRAVNSLIESEVARFCDKHIYCGDITFNRCNNRALQKSGIDGYLTIPKLDIYNEPTDEKVAEEYVNHPIGTYLMELSQITRDGREVDGWFLSNDNKTEYYILMYLWALVPQHKEVNKIVSEWKEIREDNISLVEYYLVKKSDILKYLEDCGFDEDRLRRGIEYMRKNQNNRVLRTRYGFKFVISPDKRECPVNICIDKSIYNKICKLHRFVGKFDYEEL